MKKSFVFIMIIALIGASCLMLSACNDKDKDLNVVNPGDFNVSALPNVSAPEDLPDYMLKIKWLDGEGKESDSAFIKNRPTVIIFHGANEDNNKKFTTNLNTDVYGTDIKLGSSGTTTSSMNPALSYYWTRQNFNIGVFHYESFTDDNFANINSKIYNKSRMSYRNSLGALVDNGLDFNLTEAFVSEWLKINADDLNGSGVQRMMEVRFIGVHVGANLALSASDYLEELYNKGSIGAQYLPTRVDILNPYFSNIGDSTVIDFKEQTTLGSALTYNSAIVEKLANYGVVMDMVESDSKFYASYGQNYTGIETYMEEDVEKTRWTDEGDSGAYLKIKSKVQYLNFNESFSANYPTTYVKETCRGDVAVLHWFLYSVNGSDSTDVAYQQSSDIRPMIDGLNFKGNSSSYVPTIVKYGVSAWTPTVYVRAMRGVEYEMKKYNSSSTATVKYTKAPMTNFQAEAYQISDLTMDKVYSVCGYIYATEDEHSPFAELRRDKVMSGVTLEIKATKSASGNEPANPTYTATVVTEADGFYSINIGKIKNQADGSYKELLGYSVAVKIQMPSNRYGILQTTNPTTSNYANVTRNSILAESGSSITMNSTTDTNFFIAIMNGGMLKKF